jgi:hypothetical protein
MEELERILKLLGEKLRIEEHFYQLLEMNEDESKWLIGFFKMYFELLELFVNDLHFSFTVEENNFFNIQTEVRNTYLELRIHAIDKEQVNVDTIKNRNIVISESNSIDFPKYLKMGELVILWESGKSFGFDLLGQETIYAFNYNTDYIPYFNEVGKYYYLYQNEQLFSADFNLWKIYKAIQEPESLKATSIRIYFDQLLKNSVKYLGSGYDSSVNVKLNKIGKEANYKTKVQANLKVFDADSFAEHFDYEYDLTKLQYFFTFFEIFTKEQMDDMTIRFTMNPNKLLHIIFSTKRLALLFSIPAKTVSSFDSFKTFSYYLTAKGKRKTSELRKKYELVDTVSILKWLKLELISLEKWEMFEIGVLALIHTIDGIAYEPLRKLFIETGSFTESYVDDTLFEKLEELANESLIVRI